ncbi:hypothetical protein KP005_04165 [Geomonas nitrogeniifigens]|uniref:Uncharacterized protein n=1 Tax=Geomonas diazotrophica TaxID=2843197 RepID=A0ABX8JSV2_9BACT|nr:hypothetical protein [Geomonas nitrogeniifigens]QWV98490.1 hypothetical protein KP005_04165 [Geomonas nitrogeniifigens]
MQVATTQSSTALPLVGQPFKRSETVGAETVPGAAATDRVDVSDQALAASREAGEKTSATGDATLQLLGDLLTRITGGDVQQLSYQQTELSAEQASLSFSGTISTKDGKEVSYGLELQYDHFSVEQRSATLQSGAEGISLGYQGSTAELTDRSFGFTLAATAGGEASTGKGVFHLNDEVSRIAKEMKPAVKEFLAATGAQGGWGQVNRLLRSTV